MDPELQKVEKLRRSPEVLRIVEKLQQMAQAIHDGKMSVPHDLVNMFHAVLLEEGNPLMAISPDMTRMFANVMSRGYLLGQESKSN